LQLPFDGFISTLTMRGIFSGHQPNSRVSGVPAWQQDLDNTEEQGARHDRTMAMERLRKLGYM
jgi:hypothetical protein